MCTRTSYGESSFPLPPFSLLATSPSASVLPALARHLSHFAFALTELRNREEEDYEVHLLCISTKKEGLSLTLDRRGQIQMNEKTADRGVTYQRYRQCYMKVTKKARCQENRDGRLLKIGHRRLRSADISREIRLTSWAFFPSYDSPD